jgi:leader peptidase (prepilin peptidase)/N-methyltransferase
VVGSAIGSFARRDEAGRRAWLRGRSSCPSCATPLGPQDLVPLASWLALRGRCRHCGAPIGVWYPLVEGAALAIAVVAFGLLAPPAAWPAAVVGWALLALALIDQRELILPDALTLPLIVAGLVVAGLGRRIGLAPLVDLPEAATGAAIGFSCFALLAWGYRRLRHREGLGLGDAKLLAAAGAWLGALRLPMVILVAALIALAVALALDWHRRPDRQVPFGPFLAIAFWLIMLQSFLTAG